MATHAMPSPEDGKSVYLAEDFDGMCKGVYYTESYVIHLQAEINRKNVVIDTYKDDHARGDVHAQNILQDRLEDLKRLEKQLCRAQMEIDTLRRGLPGLEKGLLMLEAPEVRLAIRDRPDGSPDDTQSESDSSDNDVHNKEGVDLADSDGDSKRKSGLRETTGVFQGGTIKAEPANSTVSEENKPKDCEKELSDLRAQMAQATIRNTHLAFEISRLSLKSAYTSPVLDHTLPGDTASATNTKDPETCLIDAPQTLKCATNSEAVKDGVASAVELIATSNQKTRLRVGGDVESGSNKAEMPQSTSNTSRNTTYTALIADNRSIKDASEVEQIHTLRQTKHDKLIALQGSEKQGQTPQRSASDNRADEHGIVSNIMQIDTASERTRQHDKIERKAKSTRLSVVEDAAVSADVAMGLSSESELSVDEGGNVNMDTDTVHQPQGTTDNTSTSNTMHQPEGTIDNTSSSESELSSSESQLSIEEGGNVDMDTDTVQQTKESADDTSSSEDELSVEEGEILQQETTDNTSSSESELSVEEGEIVDMDTDTVHQSQGTTDNVSKTITVNQLRGTTYNASKTVDRQVDALSAMDSCLAQRQGQLKTLLKRTQAKMTELELEVGLQYGRYMELQEEYSTLIATQGTLTDTQRELGLSEEVPSSTTSVQATSMATGAWSEDGGSMEEGEIEPRKDNKSSQTSGKRQSCASSDAQQKKTEPSRVASYLTHEQDKQMHVDHEMQRTYTLSKQYTRLQKDYANIKATLLSTQLELTNAQHALSETAARGGGETSSIKDSGVRKDWYEKEVTRWRNQYQTAQKQYETAMHRWKEGEKQAKVTLDKEVAKWQSEIEVLRTKHTEEMGRLKERVKLRQEQYDNEVAVWKQTTKERYAQESRKLQEEMGGMKKQHEQQTKAWRETTKTSTEAYDKCKQAYTVLQEKYDKQSSKWEEDRRVFDQARRQWNHERTKHTLELKEARGQQRLLRNQLQFITARGKRSVNTGQTPQESGRVPITYAVGCEPHTTTKDTRNDKSEQATSGEDTRVDKRVKMTRGIVQRSDGTSTASSIGSVSTPMSGSTEQEDTQTRVIENIKQRSHTRQPPPKLKRITTARGTECGEGASKNAAVSESMNNKCVTAKQEPFTTPLHTVCNEQGRAVITDKLVSNQVIRKSTEQSVGCKRKRSHEGYIVID